MWIWLVEKLHLYLLPLPLEIRNLLLQLHGGLLLIGLLVDGGVTVYFLLIAEVEVVIQVVTILVLAVVGTFVCRLGDLVQGRVNESAQEDYMEEGVP
jgi:hypothetical protein